MNTTLQSIKLMSKKYRRVLTISDQHHPYEHPDMLAFLKMLKDKYDPDLVLNGGDEVDAHGFSYHEKEPDLPGAAQELNLAIEKLQKLYKLFPNMHILDSNHGSLIFRKAKTGGLPSHVLRSAKEVLKAPKNWIWGRDITFNTPLGPVHAVHGKTSVSGKLSRNMAMSTVQFHFHTKFQIDYWGSPAGLFWDMHSGCLVDDKSLAMAYNKIIMQRPVIGTGLVIEGRPILEPMLLDRGGRWIQR